MKDDYATSYIVAENLGGLVAAVCPWPTEIDKGEWSRVEANAAYIALAMEYRGAMACAVLVRGNLLSLAIPPT